MAGWANTAEERTHAFITSPDGLSMRDLGTLGGTYSRAFDINNAGQVVGESEVPEGFYRRRAFIGGSDAEGMRNLGTLGGDPLWDTSSANAINEAGQVVGASTTADGSFHAFITAPDGMGMRDLGTLGGEGGDTYASDINETGQVVGYANRDGMYRAFITGPDGMDMRDLGSLGDPGTLGGDESWASAINDAGRVVGWSDTTAGGISHAFITGLDGTGMTDLNSLANLPEGIVLTAAFAINDAGQVIATAVPEPEIYALFLAGLGLVGFKARTGKPKS